MLLNADQIFFLFNTKITDDYNIFKNIINKVTFIGDSTCLRKGLSINDNIIRHQKCKGCRIISLLIKEDILDKEIKIMAGKNTNSIIEIKESDFDIFEIKENFKNKTLLEKYNKKISLFSKEEKHTLNIKFYQTSNELLNLIIINIILINIMKEKNYPCVNNYLYHYFCGNKLYYFSRKYDINDINYIYKIEREISKKILLQIIIFFKFFSNYYFIHNQAGIDFLRFDIELIEFEIDDKRIISPIKVYVEPSVYSSITLFNKKEAKRFFNYNRNNKDIIDMPFEDFDIDINGSKNFNKNAFDIEYIEHYKEERIFFYKIGNRYIDFLEIRKYKGIPLVSKSFDVVCFFISLLLNENFYDNFYKNYKLLIVWKGLWKKDEYKKLTEELNSWRYKKHKNNFDLVFHIIKNYYIRFDALEYLYQSL